MPRIYFDYQVFTCFDYGGIARYFRELISNLVLLPDVDVIASSPLYSNAGCGLPEQIQKSMWIKIPRVRYAKGVSLLVNDYLYRGSYFLNSTGKSIDILHQTFNINRYKAKGVPVVQTVHDLIPEKFGDSLEHKSKLVDEADHIICVSEATRLDFLEHYNYDAERVSVVHHGLSRLSNFVDKSVVSIGKPYLLFVGRRGGYKNFELLIRAYANSAFLSAEFDLVCFGGSDFNTQELEFLTSNSLDLNQVRRIQGSDGLLANYYNNASLFVYPSLCEGFGLPLLEAMDMGCPICCSNIRCFREVAGESVEYFDPNDVDSIQAALETVASSTAKAEELKAKGLLQAKKYSWEKCANQTLAVYKSLLD